MSSYNVYNIINEIKSKYNNPDIDDSLKTIQSDNQRLYYKLDIFFVNNVDIKYKSYQEDIINKYKSIDIKKIFKLNKNESVKINNLLKEIDKDIGKLKIRIRNDLVTVIDYVDRVFNKLDISNITKNTSLGILILNKYDSVKLYSANINFSDLNAAMKRQAKRLIYLKELDYLINLYKNSNSKYNIDNTKEFINNLYEIVGNYLFLLTSNEFEYTKEAIKKILAYKYDFIDKYLPTYKIILSKIWNSRHTQDYYFICSLNLDIDNIYLMNNNNISCYDKTGYICDVPKNFINYFNMDNMELIKFPLPSTLKDKYELDIPKFDKSKVNLKALYTTIDNVSFKSILPIIKINKNKNSV